MKEFIIVALINIGQGVTKMSKPIHEVRAKILPHSRPSTYAGWGKPT